MSLICDESVLSRYLAVLCQPRGRVSRTTDPAQELPGAILLRIVGQRPGCSAWDRRVVAGDPYDRSGG